MIFDVDVDVDVEVGLDDVY